MKPGRRLFALIAAFAIAFGALWPLVSAALPKTPAFPNFICSQAGFQGDHPVAPAHDEALAKFHCPLCVVSVEATLPALPPAPAWMPAAREAPASIAPPLPRACFEARPPPSRGPPLS